MNKQKIMNQDMHPKASAYPSAYPDTKNVFITLLVMTLGEGQVYLRIEDVEI
jgi:hypothetical protein